MHYSAARIQSYISVCHHIPGALFNLCKVEQRLVFHAAELLSLNGFNYFKIFSQHVYKRSGQDISFPVLTGIDVILCGVHAQRHIARKRPWRSSPGQKIGFFHTFNLKGHKSRSLFYILITLSHLVTGKSGAAAGAIGHDFMPLIKQLLFSYLFKRPPL